MRVERQDRRGQRQILRGFGQALEHRQMTAMHTIEVADSQRHGDRAALG